MRVTHSIDIRTPAETAWQITIDVERWPAWSPTATSVVRGEPGPLVLGSSAQIKQPRMREAAWRVTAMDATRSFTWETRRIGLRMAGTHRITPTKGGCRSELELEVKGWLGRVIWLGIRGAIGKSLAKENEGLKGECERRSNG